VPADRRHHVRLGKVARTGRLGIVVVDPAQPCLLELASQELEPPTRSGSDLLV
jgi:hypothetical protein